jgi:hypothetical protein
MGEKQAFCQQYFLAELPQDVGLRFPDPFAWFGVARRSDVPVRGGLGWQQQAAAKVAGNQASR